MRLIRYQMFSVRVVEKPWVAFKQNKRFTFRFEIFDFERVLWNKKVHGEVEIAAPDAATQEVCTAADNKLK